MMAGNSSNAVRLSLRPGSDGWIETHGLAFKVLCFGESHSKDAPIAVFVRADESVGDRIAGRRTHETAVFTTVIDGSLELDGRWCKPGDFQLAAAGAPHGDVVIGPDGATYMMLFGRRSGLIPSFLDPEDQRAFDVTLRGPIERLASGQDESAAALLPPRNHHTPRRGIKVTNKQWGGVVESPPPPSHPGLFFSAIDDDSLNWGPPILNARTSLLVVGEPDDPHAAVVGCINVKPGPGDRLRSQHIHPADAVNLVIRGSIYMDGAWLRPGEAKIAPGNVPYGDGLAGPDGVQFFEIWSDLAGTMPTYSDPDDHAFFEQFRAKGHGEPQHVLSS
jgi:hypothetical protein